MNKHAGMCGMSLFSLFSVRYAKWRQRIAERYSSMNADIEAFSKLAAFTVLIINALVNQKISLSLLWE